MKLTEASRPVVRVVLHVSTRAATAEARTTSPLALACIGGIATHAR